LPPQLTEQGAALQVTWHVAPAQLTLPLASTVKLQVVPPVQLSWRWGPRWASSWSHRCSPRCRNCRMSRCGSRPCWRA